MKTFIGRCAWVVTAALIADYPSVARAGKKIPLPRQKTLYVELWKALDMAQKQADARYPPTSTPASYAYNAYEHKMEQKYYYSLRKRFRLTEQQQDQIEQAGTRNNWPTE